MGIIDSLQHIDKTCLMIFFVVDFSGSMTGKRMELLNSLMDEFINAATLEAHYEGFIKLKITVIGFPYETKLQYDEDVEFSDYVYNPLETNETFEPMILSELNKRLTMENYGFMNKPKYVDGLVIIFISDNMMQNYETGLDKLKKTERFSYAIKAAIAVGDNVNLEILSEFIGCNDAIIKVGDVKEITRKIHYIFRNALYVSIEEFPLIHTKTFQGMFNYLNTPYQNVNMSEDNKMDSSFRFGDYEWIVLEEQNDRMLILSKDIIEERVYHNFFDVATWENCNLRAYLNESFYSFFNDADRSRIISVNNINENNQWYGTNGGANTSDKIFLLSIDEVVKYFGDSGQLANKPAGKYLIDDQFNSSRAARYRGRTSSWWLRSSGEDTDDASRVDDDGYLDMSGTGFYSFYGGIRPALWLKK